MVIVKEAANRPKKDVIIRSYTMYWYDGFEQRARPLILPLPLNSPEVSDDYTPSVFLRRSCTPEYSDDSLSAADSAIHIAKPKESRRLKASRVSLPAPRNSVAKHFTFIARTVHDCVSLRVESDPNLIRR